jgi:hypothetical protein
MVTTSMNSCKGGKVGRLASITLRVSGLALKWVQFLLLSALMVIGTLALFEIMPIEPLEWLMGDRLFNSWLGFVIIAGSLPALIILLIWRVKRRVFG